MLKKEGPVGNGQSVSERHSTFIEKAHRLNRTKVFVTENKKGAQQAVENDDFRDYLTDALGENFKSVINRGGDAAADLEKKAKELKERFDAKVMKKKPTGTASSEISSSQLSNLKLSSSLFEFDSVDRFLFEGTADTSILPFDSLGGSSRKHHPPAPNHHPDKEYYTSPSYIDPGGFPPTKSSKASGGNNWISPSSVSQQLPIDPISHQRSSLDSRASNVHSQSKLGLASSSLNNPPPPVNRVNGISSSSDKYPPISSSTTTTTTTVFATTTHDESSHRHQHAQKFNEAVQQSGKPKRDRLLKGSEQQPAPKTNDFKTDRVHLYPQAAAKIPSSHHTEPNAAYDALNPIPLNYTYDSILNRRAVARAGIGYDTEENQSVALATEVIKDLKEKYSVSAVRSMYRRRKIHDEMVGRAMHNEERRRMKPDEAALEWRKVRVEENRRRKVGNPDNLAASDDFATGENDGGATGGGKKNSKKTAREDLMHCISGLTLIELSTNNFYKSEKEMECRNTLRQGKSVLLRSNALDNNGSAFDSRLALQMLSTTVLRDIDGGIIPRASEIYSDATSYSPGVPTGDWEMLLEPKGVDGKDNKYKGKTQFEFKLPKEWNDTNRVARLTTAPV